MDLNDYRLRAYKKASEKPKEGDTSGAAVESGNPEVKNFIHKPVFEKISTKPAQNSAMNSAVNTGKNRDDEYLKEAEFAAKTGTWFAEKKSVTTEADVKQAADILKEGGLIKVPRQEIKPGEKESVYHRVAKFLLVIGIDEAAKILPHLTEEQTEKIIPEIASIQKVTPEEAEEVLKEFQSLLDKARENGGLDTARNILTKAFGDKKAKDLLAKTGSSSQEKPFEFLRGVEPERIQLLLHEESASVKSLVLSQLEPKTAAAIISNMPAEEKKDIVLRLAKMKPVLPEILQKIDRSLHDKMLTQNTEKSQLLDGKNALAQILKRMTPSAEEKILGSLSEENPVLGAELRERLFTEEDVLGADNRFLQNYLHNMQDTDIAYLIAGKKEGFREKILTNVSKTRAEIILEEEQIRKPMKKSDCERITSFFYSSLRRAWEEGKLIILGRDDEIYV